MGDHKFTIKQQKYKVSDEIKQGEASDLFGTSPSPSSHLPSASEIVELHDFSALEPFV